MFLKIRSHRIATSFMVLVAVAVGLLKLAPIYGQVTGATLSGTVTDASGAVVPGAQISIKNLATGVTRDVVTDTAGFYTAPNLLPGSYEVRSSAPGFTTEVRSGILLTVGAEQVLNLKLRVGSVTEQVQVVGAAPAVQLATSSISAVVNSTTVRELPLNGRSWTDLATLQPGVDAIQTQVPFETGNDRGTRGFGAQLTISGARPQQNNYRLDGVSLNDYANGGPGSVIGGNLGVDAIQEFSVLTTNYSAEYGRTSGGVVNAITRPGTNQFHGAVYEFLRNSALDARNFFDGKIPPFRRNQFGAAAGGPIRKDQTFVFGDYEAIRQSKGIAFTDTVPSATARAGNLSTGAVTVDPSTAKYLPFYPLPNGPLLSGGDIGVFSFAAQQVVNENFLTTRVDHRISDKDSLFGTYMYDDTDYHSPDSLDNVLVGSHTNRQIGVFEESHTFTPALVNTARLGYNREGAANNASKSAINPLAADPSLGAVPGRDAAQVMVTGLTALPGGLSGTSTYFYYWNSFQAYDDAFLTRGTHSLKFGVAIERMDFNSSGISNANGVFSFGSLRDLLVNKPSRFNSAFGGSRPRTNLRQTIFGAYVQDDWRWRPNLTFNLGLRYEMATVPTEVQGRLSNLLNITDPTAHLGSPWFLNPTLRNFDPRVGFAWDPFRNGKTAVRGGFGLFDVLPLPYQYFGLAQLSQPFFEGGFVQKVPSGAFFAGAYPLLSLSTLRQTFIEHSPKRDYVMQWNFNIQRELTPQLTALIGYVGSRGVHQPFRVDNIDNVTPEVTSAGYLFPSPVGSGPLINPAFGSMRGMFYEGDSYYDALEVGIQKRMSHGLQAQGSFTWGKAIDTNSASVAGDQFSNSISSWWNWYNTKVSRAVADFNVGRTLILNVTWDVPGLKTSSTPVRWLTGGWELGGIYKASDGVPFTATFGTDGDPLGLNGDDPWDFPDRVTGPGCKSPINPGNPNNYIKTQCFVIPTAPSAAFYKGCDSSFGTFPQCFNLRGNSGRNILVGPGTSNLDFSVFKNNPIRRISESFNVQFRAEFFNILNRANFAVPVTPDNTDIFDSTGAPTGVAGLLRSTTTTAREIQFALRLIW
jgi:outer membrane receptor protein involved in Fe transport